MLNTLTQPFHLRHGPRRVRHALRVRGTVQGVGFRPTVYRLAHALHLTGAVWNDEEGVRIEIEGDGDDDHITRFIDRLRRESPPLAEIASIEVLGELTPHDDHEFRIARSASTSTCSTSIPTDIAICTDCLRELFDPCDRRFGHPFITCTSCGPRYTIICDDLPYDRAQTTMARFPMCEACRAEYEDPNSRRFHAETIACPSCGPTLAHRNVLAEAADHLANGRIVALKGLGGYQLAVDAKNEAAVARLRDRKSRLHKPFALMTRDLRVAEEIVVLDTQAVRDALTSVAQPIVLLPRRRSASSLIANNIAPGLGELGVMLPTTPLHHLLFAQHRTPPILVMTSGNRSEEPIAKDDDDAEVRLQGVADILLTHDRAIHTRADDSVVRGIDNSITPIRLGRGLTPNAITIPGIPPQAPSVLAVGAELKNTICVTRNHEAFVSQHIGDLSNFEAQTFFEEVIAKLARLLGVKPLIIAHDLHPEYASTKFAEASAENKHLIAVQHHHAHVAACLAENGRTGPAIGIAFDGTGCGPAGDLWGGEILAFDLCGFERLGHLRPIALAGGEAAIREPWRVGVAALIDAGLPFPNRHPVAKLIEQEIRCPRATGAGRWFDAVAGILGIRDRITYEAQAAIELEALALAASIEPNVLPYPFALEPSTPFVIDLRPTIREIVRDRDAGRSHSEVAARFYRTMAHTIASSCNYVLEQTPHFPRLVGLSGGCFQSPLLTTETKRLLEREGFEVLTHRRVPCNDGGIALGQAAIAMHRLARRTTPCA